MQGPDQLRYLRDNLLLVPGTMKEMLRYDAPIQQAEYRFVGEAVTLSGHHTQPEQSIVVVLGSANHDPVQLM